MKEPQQKGHLDFNGLHCYRRGLASALPIGSHSTNTTANFSKNSVKNNKTHSSKLDGFRMLLPWGSCG